MAIISKTEFDRLVKVSELQSFGDNSYLRDINNENFKWICKQFFYGDEADTKLFNVGSGIFGTVQNVLSNFVGNPNVGKDFDITQWVNDYVATGYCAMVLYREDGAMKVRREPAESVSYENGTYRVIKIYIKDVESSSGKLVSMSTTKKTYVLVQTYKIGSIENALYEVKGLYQITAGTAVQQVPLTTIFETEHLKDIEPTGEDYLTIFLIKEKDVDTLAKLKGEFEKIMNMVYAIDRRVVMFDNQFLNNVESFILLKNIVLPKKTIEQYNDGKKVNFKQLGRILTANDDGGIEFINNKNELIDKAISYEEVQIRRISSVTTIPTDFFGLKDGSGGVGTGSREVLHGAFIKTIEQIRDRFVKGLAPILEILAKEKDAEIGEKIIWGDVFAKSSNDVVTELKTARESKLISQFRAIKMYTGFDDAEAQKEMDAINEEDAEAIDPANDIPDNPEDMKNPDGTPMSSEEQQKKLAEIEKKKQEELKK